MSNTANIASFEKVKKKNRRKRGADSPAEGDNKDLKRPNQTAAEISGQKETTPTMSNTDSMEGAIVEIAARVGDCVTAHGDIVPTLNTHSDLLFKSNEEIKDLRRENQRLTKRLDNLEAAHKTSNERLGEVERTANSNAHSLKNANLVIEGIVENVNEDCRSLVCEIFKILEDKCGSDDVISAYRIGNATEHDKFPRPIIVKMVDPVIKLMLMENKWKLFKNEKYSGVFLNDDLPPAIKKERRELREICKFARQQGYQGCKVSGSKLVVEGKAYRHNTLHLLPQELQLCNVKTRRVGDGLGFQGEASYLSNFYPATLRMEDNCFISSEQAYQFFKARICKREDSALKILNLVKPREIKLAGDNVPSTAVWEQNKEGFM